MENFLFLLYNKIVFQFRKNALFQFLERLITQFHSTRNNTKDRQSKKKASSGYSIIQEVYPHKPKTLLQKANPVHNHTRLFLKPKLPFPLGKNRLISLQKLFSGEN